MVRQMIDAMRDGDVSAMERTLSRTEGSVLIGTDAAEHTRDIDEMMRIMRDSTPDEGHRITTSLPDVRGYQEGDVGWVDGIGRFERDGRSVEVRMTGVAHRENGEWRFVQTHASIGVPNERMFDSMFQSAAAAGGG
jgi:hypothetical protein